MNINRRNLLRYAGLSAAGMAFAKLDAFAVPLTGGRLTDKPQQDQPLRLSSNENPYGPSPMARSAMAEYISASSRYRWDLLGELTSAIAQLHKVPEESILPAAGSTGVLNMIVRLFAGQQGSYVVAEPSFNGWTATADELGLKKIAIPLTGDKKTDLLHMLGRSRADTKFIYVCNPNNPTGTFHANTDMEAFVAEGVMGNTVIVVDEAYLDYTAEASLATTAAETKNVIVVRTFSKLYGLAGARIGYAVAHPDTIAALSRLQTWAGADVSVLSRVAAIASLKDRDFVAQCRSDNEQVKKYTANALDKLGITCIPSGTNFLYYSLANYKGDFFERLKSNHIEGTRVFEEEGRWSRITIGTLTEMQRFIAALQ